MELYSGVHQIRSIFGGRNLFQYLFVGDNVLLVDTGIAETPERVIFPYLEELELKPTDITLATTTHADVDHQGGNDAIKVASPRTLLACGDGDRELVGNPRILYERRYNHLKSEHAVGFEDEPSVDAGKPRSMDLTFSGGERIRLRDDWWLEVLHVPGHSEGHLAFYDSTNRAAFTGDAVQGSGCPKSEGGIAIPVTYYHVDMYLSTIRYLERLDIDRLFTGHWPAMTGEEVKEFFEESRRTVEFFDRVILEKIAKCASGMSMTQIIDAVAQAVGDWPKDGQLLAMFPVKGHMDRLVDQGKVRRADSSDSPAKWLLA